MSNFSKPRFQRPSFGKKPFGNKRGFDQGPKQKFQAECAQCGKSCEVPFRPNGEKPVYCSDCFVRDDAGRSPRHEFAPRPSFGGGKPAPRPDQAFNDLKAELRVVNQNLERLIAIMTPKTVAPVQVADTATVEPKAKTAAKTKEAVKSSPAKKAAAKAPAKKAVKKVARKAKK